MKKRETQTHTLYVVPAKTRDELTEKGYIATDKIQISPGYYTGPAECGYTGWNEEKHYQIWKKDE